MRLRTLSLIASVALLGAAVAVPSALAAPSEVKLEVNENCVELEWPCWTTEGLASRPHPRLSVTIASGGMIMFVDHDKKANIAWTATPSGPPACEPSVPVAPTAPMTPWEGKCTFATSGTYKFESSTLWYNPPYENYTKYEVIVAGAPTPTATTEQATEVTETEATLNGSVNPEGQATSYYFEYGSTESYGTKTSEVSAGSGSASQEVHYTPTGLSPDTTYYFQLVAVYGAGKTKVEGGSMSFKTAAPPSAPAANTQPATAISETEATLKGTVNPDGEATEYFFEYGTETSYGQKTGEVTLPASESDQVVSATVKGLAPGTKYHFRVVAKNKLGPVQGNDLTFMTVSSPPAKEPAPTPTSTGGNPTATASSSPSSGQPTASGSLFGSVKLTSAARGGVVHGSLVVSSVGSEGRLQIELLTKGAASAVGKLVRSSLHAGKLTFALLLNAKGKAALRHHRRLTLTVKITLTPVHGAAVTVTRDVVIHA